jgi:hypothetical protein
MSSPLIKPLSAQLAGLVFVYALSRNGILPTLPLFWLAGLQGCFAAIVSMLLLGPRWWIPIHMGFFPAIIGATRLHLPPTVYATGFIVLALIYWSSFRTQVPLFLSNRITVYRLAIWLADERPLKVLDVGSGTGSFARRLAQMRPDWQIGGIETAPAPYLLSRWLARKCPNLNLVRGDFWQHSLAGYDVVYAFLSPAPMEEFWRKARREMAPGSLLISNSFTIPEVTPDSVITVDDRRQTLLYVYRLPKIKTIK